MHPIKVRRTIGWTVKLRRKFLEAKAGISVSGVLAKYTYKAKETIMNKKMSYKSFYMFRLLKQEIWISQMKKNAEIHFSDNAEKLHWACDKCQTL